MHDDSINRMSRWLVTTSWDDGDPLDLRLAERLANRGVAATFYLCRRYDGRPRLLDREIRALADLPHVEIGAHTLTHPDLRRVDESKLRDEVYGSRLWLQDLLGRDVRAFCYPRGLHNRRVVRAVQEAGYALGRTTLNGHIGSAFNPFRMPTTHQLFPHPRLIELRHAAKEGNVRGLVRFARLFPWPSGPCAMTRALSAPAITPQTQVLHVWGHSWELETHNLWPQLDAIFDVIDSLNANALTNSAVVEAVVGGRGAAS